MVAARSLASQNTTVIQASDRFGALGPGDYDNEEGTGFGYHDRLFQYFRDGKVFDYGDSQARDIDEMFGRYDKAAQLSQVQSGPIEGADAQVKPIKGDSGEAEWLQQFLEADEFSNGMDTPIELVRAQMTSAFDYRKAFFELVWTRGQGQFAGKNTLSRIAFRPANTCRTVRTPQGQLLGFEQDPWYAGGIIDNSLEPKFFNRKRSFIYVHGQRRDPVNGVSDMQIPFWCYKTMQKLLFLWMQYAEQSSLPRVTVTTADDATSRAVAGQIASSVNSGVIPISAPQGADSVELDTLDISGKGAGVFSELAGWLSQSAANSIVAGFTNLTDFQKDGGSRALSSDSSDFYLQRLESKSREMERDIRHGIFAPLIRYNFGMDAAIPKYAIDPLNTEDVTPQLDILTAAFGVPGGPAYPAEFIEELVAQVSQRWGLDVAKMRTAVREASAKAEKIAEENRANQQEIAAAKTAGAVGEIDRQTRPARERETAGA